MFSKYGRVFSLEEIEENKMLKFVYDSSNEIIFWYKEIVTRKNMINGLEDICSHIPNDEGCTVFPDIIINIIDNDNINAFAAKVYGKYYINIYIGVLKYLYPIFEKELGKSKFFNYDNKKNRMIMLDLTIKYLTLHEFFHIKNGHCEFKMELDNTYLFESNTEIQKINHIHLQTLEYDADCCAIYTLVYWVMKDVISLVEYKKRQQIRFNKIIIKDIVDNLSLIVLSIYSLLEKLDKYFIRSNEELTLEFLQNMTHPIAISRIRYMIINLLYAIAKFCFGEEIKLIVEGVLDNFKVYLINEANLSYASYFFDIQRKEIIVKHIQKIHNDWKHVKKVLNVYYGELPVYKEFEFC